MKKGSSSILGTGMITPMFKGLVMACDKAACLMLCLGMDKVSNRIVVGPI